MKLLIAGSGFIVQDFLPITKDLKKTKLTAIAATSHSLERMKQMQQDYPIENVYTDYEQALKKTDADTVYVAVPNSLHYRFVKEALQAGKNVICEKPFTVKYSEFQELKDLATAKKLILVEAITTQYLTNYAELKEKLPEVGPVRIVSMNFSQYSHRYDAFKAGKITPVFDPKEGGGALMDLNVYNIHFLVGLFGLPKSVEYRANFQRGVDTSGILNLDYGNFKAVSIAAKDVAAPETSLIEGENKTIVVNGPVNSLASFEVLDHSNHDQHVDKHVYPHRMYEEFVAFEKMIDHRDLVADQKALVHSDQVMQVLQKAIESGGLNLE